jgi:hypothetical protein
MAALMLVCAFGTVTHLAAQKIAAPTTSPAITTPSGNSVFLVGYASGTQGYVCLSTSTGAPSWTLNGARPEATLFESSSSQDSQILTHFLSPDANPNEFAPDPLPFGSPTWQSSLDTSRVWGKPLASIPAGSDASCSNAGAISCLLLQSIGSQQGSTGGKVMTQTTYIQRLNTKGGSPPANGCAVPGDVGKQILVPYSADYYFFRAAK